MEFRPPRSPRLLSGSSARVRAALLRPRARPETTFTVPAPRPGRARDLDLGDDPHGLRRPRVGGLSRFAQERRPHAVSESLVGSKGKLGNYGGPSALHLS